MHLTVRKGQRKKSHYSQNRIIQFGIDKLHNETKFYNCKMSGLRDSQISSRLNLHLLHLACSVATTAFWIRRRRSAERIWPDLLLCQNPMSNGFRYSELFRLNLTLARRSKFCNSRIFFLHMFYSGWRASCGRCDSLTRPLAANNRQSRFVVWIETTSLCGYSVFNPNQADNVGATSAARHQMALLSGKHGGNVPAVESLTGRDATTYSSGVRWFVRCMKPVTLIGGMQGWHVSPLKLSGRPHCRHVASLS